MHHFGQSWQMSSFKNSKWSSFRFTSNSCFCCVLYSTQFLWIYILSSRAHSRIFTTLLKHFNSSSEFLGNAWLWLRVAKLNVKTQSLNKSNLDFDPFGKQLCYCTCLCKIFEVNYLRGKYNQCSAAPLMPSIVLCILLWGS